ncbi:hypothetical protein [Streptomyces specialis]|uniref:hypothetical protein n=1 Tax=Streptomyces specialis TaxID=498367 RepID=UPI00131A6388|nr:hypothetical protein [Streptomyces specialis]
MGPVGTLTELVALPDAPAPAALAGLPESLGDSHAQYLGHAQSPPGALTTTLNRATGRRIGLHIDNWDKLPCSTRHQARRRLCYNLGPGARYLILGDADIRTIARARHPHTDDLRAYAADHPLRCVRIRLDPGEGYLAPTELHPHDGSTQHQDQPSTVAFWLGHWPRGILRSLV